MTEVVSRLLGQADLAGRIADATVSDRELKQNALFTLAEQVGSALKDERGSALRDSITLRGPRSPGPAIAATTSRTSAARSWSGSSWRRWPGSGASGWRTSASRGSVSLARAAEEGATAAQHLLGMCVRAIDYLPPVEFEFPDFLAALLTSDAEVVPDDKHRYRDAVRGAFGRWGIAAADNHIDDLSQSGLSPSYRNVSYRRCAATSTRSSGSSGRTSSSCGSTRASTSTSSTSARPSGSAS